MPPRADAERLRRLQLVTDAALAHLELDELLAELLGRIHDILEVDTVAVLMLDEAGKELVARAAIGVEDVERDVRIPIGAGFAGRVAAEQRAIVLEDVDHADVLNPLLREKGIKSMLGVPLGVGGQVFGVLHVGTLQPRDFTQDDIELLQLVADRTAIAVEHARLFEAERHARLRLEQLQTVTDTALWFLELDDLLGELLQRIRGILRADTVAVLMLDESGEELVARAAVGLEEEVERGVRIPIGAGFAGRVAAERKPIVLEDVDHADVLNPILRQRGVKSLLGVPLVVGDEVRGVLHVGTLAPRMFTDEDVELLQLVADRAAVAIERARVHDELVRLDQLKLNFVAIAAHELRTPATTIYGITSTLRERGDELPDAARDELEEALSDQATRLRLLIEQLLDLSRLDAQAMAIEPQPLPLRPLLAKAASRAADDPSAEIRVDVDDGFEVVADRMALEQIVSNLVANAVRHGQPPIVLRAEQRDQHLRISVEDSGKGVPAEFVPRLFERFERTGMAEGTGLGLAIAQAYARAHGGDLVYDRGERGGARFELILPR